MQRLVGKIILSLVLLAMSGCLLWYAIGSSCIATRDLEFLGRHSSFEFFPEVSFWLGSQAYYDEVNPAKAAGYFREAIGGQVLLVDAWFGLAKAELALGHEEVAHRIFAAITPAITQVSTWKWQEFLLAFDLRDEAKFVATFNFILARLPHRVGEAFQLALRYWGNYASILSHLIPGNRSVGLQELMNVKAIDETLVLWKLMSESSPASSQELRFRFCEFLLNNERIPDAKELWKGIQGDRDSGVYDGGFEREPVNMAFGWRIGRLSEVDIERTRVEPYQGDSCLHLYFHGKKNIDFSQVFQIIPVEPGQRIRLRFATKSRNLSTDQGVFVEVNGYRCSGLHAQSKPVVETKAWGEEELDVPVPLGCEAIVVQLRRKESLMFDNKISGDYWFDAVTLEFDRIQ